MTTKAATLDRSKFPLEVQCTSGEGSAVIAAEASDKTPPTLDIVAYSGGPLDLGYCLMYCDGEGATLPASMPIFRQHDASKIVGQSSAPISKGADGSIRVKANFMPTDFAREVRECAAAGMKWQASMGFRPDYTSAQWLDNADSKATVNGREVTGPRVVIARKWTLKETSVVPLGADGKTSATVTAFADPQQIQKNRRTPTMSDPVPATVQQLRAAFPDAEDREFVLAQLEAGATLEAANAAYVGILRERLTTAKAPAPALAPAPKPSPRQAVPLGVAASAPSAPAPSNLSRLVAKGMPANAGPATVAYFEAVNVFAADGMSQDDARAAVSRQLGEIHDAYITEVNGGQSWQRFPMQTARGEVRR